MEVKQKMAKCDFCGKGVTFGIMSLTPQTFQIKAKPNEAR